MKKKLLAVKDVNTRFGKISINLEYSINFPAGLLGMPRAKNFCLTHFPDKKYDIYKLLQSIDEDELCFLIVPLSPQHFADEKSLIARSDVLSAIKSLEIVESNVQLLLVATIHHDIKARQSKVSVNLKAPIIIDTERMFGVQHVFLKEGYSLQYFLT